MVDTIKSKLFGLKMGMEEKKAELVERVNTELSTPMKGATAMEYVLIVSIMATVIIIAWKTFLGPAIKTRMKDVSNEIKAG